MPMPSEFDTTLILRPPLAVQPQQIPGPHEEDLAAVALAVAVGRLLKGEVDHSVDDLWLVAAERPHRLAPPGVGAVDGGAPDRYDDPAPGEALT